MFSLFGFFSLHRLIGEKMRKVIFLRTLLGNVSTHIGGKKSVKMTVAKEQH